MATPPTYRVILRPARVTYCRRQEIRGAYDTTGLRSERIIGATPVVGEHTIPVTRHILNHRLIHRIFAVGSAPGLPRRCAAESAEFNHQVYHQVSFHHRYPVPVP